MNADIEAVLFDLDGTLVDTAPDMAHVLNLVCAEQDRPPVPFEQARVRVSNGAIALLQLAFADVNEQRLAELRVRYLALYADNLARHSALFDGMGALLDELDDKGLPWGVVTNKPAAYTEPLLQQLALAGRAACIVSGDTAARAKPHPDPLLLASRLIDVPASACLYLGDDERDVIAAHAAGMYPVVAAYGYLDAHCTPAAWNAAAIIGHPAELAAHLQLAGCGS